MDRNILIRGARQLLTLHGPSGPRRGPSLRELSLIEDGSVLISNGVIATVGPTRRVENLAQARSAEEIDATGRIILPGFIDPYIWLNAPPARSFEVEKSGGVSDQPAGEDIAAAALQHIRTSAPGRLKSIVRKTVEACIRHGTTTICAKTGYGLDKPSELKALRACAADEDECCSVITAFVASAIPARFEGGAKGYVSWLCEEMLPAIRMRRLATFVDVVCDPAAFSSEQAHEFLSCAKRLELLPGMQVEQTTHTGVVRTAIELESRYVIGLNHADQLDAQALGRSRTIATLVPAAGHSRSARPPARALIASGAAVALGSGFHPSLTSTLNMQTVISLACSEMGLTPEEAISAATINSAHAVQRASISGSLESGKEADLIMLDIPDYREIPYHLGVNLVSMTMRKGEVLYRQGVVNCLPR